MKYMAYVIIFIVVLLLNFQIADAAENEYGTVKAWFDGKNATVTGIELKVGEPVEIKIEVESKINGHVFVKLTEPGVTKAFDVISGPSNQDERIDNLNIANGWSKLFIWKIKPNGAWKNGNAPINILVSFYNLKKDNQKPIQFTIANPYILDEQYAGAASKPKATSTPTGTLQSTSVKETPFLPVIITVSALILAWRWRREM
jgi:sarcinarray family protein